ncbi:MAG: HypC/HybG/HupF family hydrogenase formation chaperone [Steroidobacteraceae bacterium]|jgi:hydrogenase expression/formation protein HypC
MCIATPMRVMRILPAAHFAECADRLGVETRVDLALVGAVEAGAWLLVFMGAAREIIDADRALQIDRALGALESALAGDLSAIDAAFPDLVGREPQLPEYLR